MSAKMTPDLARPPAADTRHHRPRTRRTPVTRAPFLALALALAGCGSARADQKPPLRLILLERTEDGVCFYEAAVRDMLVAVLVRQQPGEPPCKPELTLP